MIRQTLSSLFIFAAASAAVAFPIKTAVVKISSSSLDGSLNFHGSGLAFKIGATGYAVTSDHVLLHDNLNKTHKLTFPGLNIAYADFVAADFGRGLALVKITSAIDLTKLPTLQDLSATQATTSAATVLMGYPAMSTGLIRDPRGHVTNAAFAVSALVQTPELIEVEGAHGEFGMSGGVAATPDDHFLGILSHQIYDEASSSNLVLAIPAQTAIDWASKVAVSSPDAFPIQLTQTTNELLWKDSLTFSSHWLSFVWIDSTSSRNFEFSVYSTPTMATPELIGGPKTAFAAIEDDFRKTDCAGYLVGFREAVPFGRLTAMASEPHEIMRLFEKPLTEPVFRMSCNETPDAINKLDAHAKALASLATKLSNAGAQNLPSVISRVVGYIQGQDENNRSTWQFFWLKKTDIDSVLSAPPYAADWQLAQRAGFEKPLRDELTQLRDLYRYLSE